MATWSAAAYPPAPGTETYTSYSMAPAYTPVPNIRQSFTMSYQQPQDTSAVYSQPYHPHPTPPPPPPPPAQANENVKVEWPDSVRRYVQRSFRPAEMYDDVSSEEMQDKLKVTISQAKDSGTMEILDWDTMPLPQHFIRQEREAALGANRSQPVPSPAVPSYQASRVDLKPVHGSRKRKSSELTDTDSFAPLPPWRAGANGNGHGSSGNSNSKGSLQDRVSFSAPEKRQAVDEKTSKFQSKLEKRQRRFDGGYKSSYRSPSPEPTDGPVVGTCMTLEKRYLRLTAPPKPSVVRPERILHETLELLKTKWKSENNYAYICDQFKSMRQDLTVQRIKNDFTVTVYEIHARIALEKGDLGEYNQCQTQLRGLYRLGLKGNPTEFKAYRILYFIHTANRAELNDAIADLTQAEKQDPSIKHALSVRSSVASGNYHRFFQLYLATPNMGAYLMDMFVGRQRIDAICNICRAYLPDVKLRFLTEELGFESDQETYTFIVELSGEDVLEQRGDYIHFLTTKAKGLGLFDSAKSEAFRTVDIKGQI